MPELRLSQRLFDNPALNVPLRVELFGPHARLLKAGYMAAGQPTLGWWVDNLGDYAIRVTRPSGESVDHFVEVEPYENVYPVLIDPAINTSHPWLADVSAFGVLDWATRPVTRLTRELRSRKRSVLLRLFDRGSWRNRTKALELEQFAADAARLKLKAESSQRLVQIGGPGTPLQLMVVPPAEQPYALLLTTEEGRGYFGAAGQLFAGDGKREALLRSLESPAIHDPQDLFLALAKDSWAVVAAEHESEHHLLLALAGLFALKFNLTANSGSGAADLLKAAASVGQKSLKGGMSGWMPTDLLVVAAWHNLLRRAEDSARNLLVTAARQELPCFAYALALLRDGLYLLAGANGDHGSDDTELASALRHVLRYTDAAIPGRGYTSFFGRSPTEPAVEPSLLGELPQGYDGLDFELDWNIGRLRPL